MLLNLDIKTGILHLVTEQQASAQDTCLETRAVPIHELVIILVINREAVVNQMKMILDFSKQNFLLVIHIVDKGLRSVEDKKSQAEFLLYQNILLRIVANSVGKC